MNLVGWEINRRVAGLLAAGLALGVVSFWWSGRYHSSSVRPTTAKGPFVRLAGSGNSQSDRILYERAEYLDPTPLFYPSNRNFGQSVHPSPLEREPGDGFAIFPPVFRFSDQRLSIYGVEGEQIPEKPADLASRGNETSFMGMGSADFSFPKLSQRIGHYEVKSIVDSRIVLAGDFSSSDLRKDFAPLTFLLVVTPDGLLGDPQPVSNLGAENEISGFQEQLAAKVRLGERLAPGAYLVSIGP